MSGKKITAKNVYLPFREAPDPFTRDLNLTTSKRRMLERLFSTLIQDVHFSHESRIKLFL